MLIVSRFNFTIKYISGNRMSFVKIFDTIHLVILAQWPHLFPYRTEKWNAVAPKILISKGIGKIGNRQSKKGPDSNVGIFFAQILPKSLANFCS